MISKKKIKKIAKQILELENEMQLGKSVQENMQKIEEIVSSLSLGEMILLDEYIQKNFDKLKNF